ncbi:MAG: tRNA-dihydrouridine synthase family protein [Desulfonauticus sp.]|nr:tRNA-dihydrouridine synthase family protein [Desulfonauticus sp.]
MDAFLATSLKLGSKEIKNRLILSPMAGLTHVVLREVILSFAAPGLLYTEMCLGTMVPVENRTKSSVFRWTDEEADILVCQLVGNEVETMCRAARRVEKEGLFGVDINMGCSISRIYNKGYGAGLLKTPDLAIDIVKKVKKVVNIPVIVKFRTGLEDNVQFAKDFALRLEDAGADALIYHPRVVSDIRRRRPRWEYIGEVKKQVTIPVFGNGNVFTGEDVKKILDVSGCDGIALGRIAAVRPWIFAELLKGFKPDGDTFYFVAKKMLDGCFKNFEPTRAIKLYKKWAVYFFANFFYANSLLKKVFKATSYAELNVVLEDILIPLPQVLSAPNLNFLR